MNYGDLIKDAFWITLRNRFLWVFGLFLGGGSQIFNLLQYANTLSMQGPFLLRDYLGDETIVTRNETIVAIFRTRDFVFAFVRENLVLFLGLVVALVLIGIFLSLVSQAALTDGVAALHRGEERRFSSSFRAGLSNFWRMLGFSVLIVLISLVIGVVIFSIVLFLGLPLSAAFGTVDSLAVRILIIFFSVLLFIGLFIVIFIPLGITILFGLRALVVDRVGIGSSLGSGYDLFRRNLGRSFLVWLVGFALSLGVGLALLIAVLIVGLVLAAPAAALSFAGLGTASLAVGVVAAVVLLIFFVVASAAASTFNHAYWTLAYLRLTALPEGAAGQEV